MPGKKILVVDDEENVIDLFGRRLASEGFEVCSAQTGEEAVAKVKSEKPLAIIMDLMMPGMSGFDAIRKIRDIREARNIPVIVVTAKAGMKDFFSDMRGVEFMSKPIDMGLLVRWLKTVAEKARSRPDQPK